MQVDVHVVVDTERVLTQHEEVVKTAMVARQVFELLFVV